MKPATLRSVMRTRESFTREMFTVVSDTAGAWPRGSTNRRVSKATRGWRFGMETLPKASRVTATPPSPGMPWRTVMRVVAA